MDCSEQERGKELDKQMFRLQDMLKWEQAKNSRLQLRCKQQEAELKRREQQSNRMKERLTQLNDREKDKEQHIQLLNFLPGGRGRKEQPIKAIKQEEAMLLLMLERREAELREAMKLRHSTTTLLHAIRLDMEQDSLPSLGPSELTDSYYLEEWERLQARWAEFEHQKQTFERERQSFTDAAIRLSLERRDFEHQKALILKQQYLSCCTQEVNKLLSFVDESLSCCIPISPYSKEPSPVTCDPASGDSHGRDRFLTPTTPELYAVLGLSYQCSAKDGER
nr:afadin- and alpha-actinin-binding protein-like isoform X4 [Nerophis lumbriciformis]